MDAANAFRQVLVLLSTGMLPLVLLASLGLAVLAVLRKRTATVSTTALAPPAPGALPLFNHTLHVIWHAARAHDWLDGFCQRFQGRPFRIVALGGFSVTMLNTPALFEDVLKTHFARFDKGAKMRENLRGLLGNGIFAVDGVQWLHQRKTASNLFTMRALRDSMAHTVQELMPSMNRIFERAVDDAEPVDLFKLLNRFTMEAFSKIGFGVDLGCLEAAEDHPFMEAFDAAQRMVTMRFVGPPAVWKLQKWLNIGNERELRKHVKVIDDTVLSIIARSIERRPNPRSQPAGHRGSDIVSLFLDDVSHDDKREGKPFDPVFLRDIVVNFLIAGRDTTAQALSWFFYELSANPRVEERIRDELRRMLPSLFERAAKAPTIDEVEKLPYLEAALRETLRLHPSVPINFKTAGEDTVLSDGTFIPKDSAVCISSYSLGRAKHVWGQDAEAFKPERWLDPQNPDKLVTVSAFQFPVFHAGPRMCLGMNLAKMEMKILIASVLCKFHMDVLPGHPKGYELSLTLPMKGQFLTRVRRW